uniref:26S proteasome non-ATPase regulatory subunit 5 n=1 Tax=Lepeophtheirus salmonis TaxID=72036 RepID=D3PK62_LEPSM|nr:26S proteasome non-ATPase regulatory subunit 5 [Lepeophtheirus salmonis]
MSDSLDLEDIFSRLSVSEEERMDIMGSMGPLIRNLNGPDVGQRVENLDLNVMFMIMSSAITEDEITLACQTLRELLKYLKPSFILERYADSIQSGLSKDAHIQIKILVLITLQQMENEIPLLMSKTSILSLATSTIAHPNLSLAKETMKFLLMLSAEKQEIIFSPPIYPILMEILDDSTKSNVIYQLRVYDFFVKVSSMSQELLNRVVETGILNSLLKMAYSEDILVKLNGLELLGDLARTSQGYQFIVKDSGISSKLDELLDVDNALCDIVLPGILKFFGNLAYIDPNIVLLNHPKFINTLNCGLKFADSNNPTYRACIETLGIIAKTQDGRNAIDDKFNVVAILQPLTLDIRNGKSDVRAISMEIFADFVNSGSSVQRNWFMTLGENSTDNSAGQVLFQMIKLPFEELQGAAYSILWTISQYEWGVHVISECPGFIEYILNRESGNFKVIKERKCDVIANILKSSDSNNLVNIFGTPNVIKMKQYVRDGPFYIRTEVNVAYEDA